MQIGEIPQIDITPIQFNPEETIHKDVGSGVEYIVRLDCFSAFQVCPHYIYISNKANQVLCACGFDLGPMIVDAYRHSDIKKFSPETYQITLPLQNRYDEILGQIHLEFSVIHFQSDVNQIFCFEDQDDKSNDQPVVVLLDDATQVEPAKKKKKKAPRVVPRLADLLYLNKKYQATRQELLKEVEKLEGEVEYFAKKEKRERTRKTLEALSPRRSKTDETEIKPKPKPNYNTVQVKRPPKVTQSTNHTKRTNGSKSSFSDNFYKRQEEFAMRKRERENANRNIHTQMPKQVTKSVRRRKPESQTSPPMHPKNVNTSNEQVNNVENISVSAFDKTPMNNNKSSKQNSTFSLNNTTNSKTKQNKNVKDLDDIPSKSSNKLTSSGSKSNKHTNAKNDFGDTISKSSNKLTSSGSKSNKHTNAKNDFGDTISKSSNKLTSSGSKSNKHTNVNDLDDIISKSSSKSKSNKLTSSGSKSSKQTPIGDDFDDIISKSSSKSKSNRTTSSGNKTNKQTSIDDDFTDIISKSSNKTSSGSKANKNIKQTSIDFDLDDIITPINKTSGNKTNTNNQTTTDFDLDDIITPINKTSGNKTTKTNNQTTTDFDLDDIISPSTKTNNQTTIDSDLDDIISKPSDKTTNPNKQTSIEKEFDEIMSISSASRTNKKTTIIDDDEFEDILIDPSRGRKETAHKHSSSAEDDFTQILDDNIPIKQAKSISSRKSLIEYEHSPIHTKDDSSFLNEIIKPKNNKNHKEEFTGISAISGLSLLDDTNANDVNISLPSELKNKLLESNTNSNIKNKNISKITANNLISDLDSKTVSKTTGNSSAVKKSFDDSDLTGILSD
ncbi:dentin sialophosphoprotein precursor [Histomonas meleagridis]|uniref:dentin sialophosphoprotein precursor n=1 Tax=Histomonas meleagridis TaxID=135588 RepID=UPI003559D614|nr:dentin sialophosphoprotein precursor [Histomonas meleagridis]KAH0805774.1 dentin sialophosphoprotein precursor [Histomonas meleagridis]